MTAIRVYEFAKNHNMSSKAILNFASKNGINFNSHMSSMTDEQQNQLNQLLSKRQVVASDDSVENESDSKQSRKKSDSNKDSHKKQIQNRSKNNVTEDENETNTTTNKPKKAVNAQKNNAVENQSNNQERQNRSSRRRGRNNRNRGNNKKQVASKGITARKHKDLPEKLVYTEGMNIQEISKVFHRDASEIIKKLLMSGIMANQNQALSKEVIELIALEYGVEPEEKVVVDKADLEIYFGENEDEELLTSRPPVVTIMGHVDHGKTTLLDQLRNTRVTEGEAGGITQHIGAYQVEIDGKPITFLDTPGHEAFTTMRARGADVTDITIIVVAANDGVMPQTVEAINHAKAANVPIIVAINKVDLPEANPDRVMQELSEHGLIPEAWGGDTIFVQISAKFNQNIDELLEMVLLVAEVEELTANSNRLAVGSVIEARLDKAQGATATLLVQQGTLRIGDPIVVGNSYGKVRTMLNDSGRRIRSAGPATPVEITGLNDAPQAGDLFAVFEDEKSARLAGIERAQRAQLQQRDSTKKITLDNLFESLSEGELKSVNVIIKGDVQGSVEALSASLQKIEVSGVRVNIIHQAVGAINESDITLAAASGAIVIGFNVRPTPQARTQASEEEIDIRQYRVIYDAIDEIETAMKGMLDPEFVEEIQGQVVVRETYTVSKVGTIAGSYVLDGYIARNSKVRVIRDNIVRYEGEIASLKRFKDDAREVRKGFECGIMIENYNDIAVDDIIEAFHMVEVKR
ncbi:translation initiation factor IF-2 [Fundicoccus sp. Sow4_H7]|uniref:translation initiation factor IF-2 n=1 Tax=Fundicoccus sp. Sow4_H7 TaxID=3438784 RepID=UPI003F8EBE44